MSKAKKFGRGKFTDGEGEGETVRDALAAHLGTKLLMAGTDKQRASIVTTRSKFFEAERAAREAIETYERAKAAYVQASERAGVTVTFEDDGQGGDDEQAI